MDDLTFERQLKADFLEEAGELLQETEDAFLALERKPADKPLIDRIFRTIHTIKGSAGVAGFKNFSNLAHAIETLLGKLRDGVLSPSPMVIDTLLSGVDGLRRFVEILKTDHGASFDVSSIHSKIEAILTESLATSGPMASPVDSVPQSPLEDPSTRVSKKILVVDADEAVRSAIEEALSCLNVSFLHAADGETALRLWRDTPDLALVITEQLLPKLEGVELLEKMRAEGAEVPMIIVAGATSQEQSIRFVKLGAFDFFYKPFDRIEILTAARNALRIHEYESTLRDLFKFSIRSYMTFRRIVGLVENATSCEHPTVKKCSSQLREMGLLIARAMASREKVGTPVQTNPNR